MNNSLPPSALLDRLKNFLPQIAKANEELEEKIRKDGTQSVIIDKDIVESQPNQQSDDNEGDDSDNVLDINEGNNIEAKPVVQIEFAMGDFDDSAIANIEENILTEKKQLEEAQNNRDEENDDADDE